MKKYTVYQIIFAYLFGRYTAYREEGHFKDFTFKEFVIRVLEDSAKND